VGAEDTSDGAQERRATKSREHVQSIERGLAVLSWLNRFGAGTSSQLVAALGLKRSTVHRILGVLVDLKLVIHEPLSHQYLLGAGAYDLSSQFRDADWIAKVAEPRMSAWTLAHRWPLVLITPISGSLVIRVSTDHLRPVAGARLVVGQVVPIEESAAGTLYRAYQHLGSADDTAGDARIRDQGFVTVSKGSAPDARLAVPLLLDGSYLGSISMRCLPEMVESGPQLGHWLQDLGKLSREIVDEAGSLIAN
jgi:DNA-binding IclR family transcriptional regulator